MPTQYARNADGVAETSNAVKHWPEDGLRFVRPFRQSEIFRSADASAAAVGGVCFGCSAYYLKNNKAWADFKTYISSGVGKGRALALSNQILAKDLQIHEKGVLKRRLYSDSTPASLRNQNSTAQMLKDFVGISDPAARAQAAQAERDYFAVTEREAHQQRLYSYRQYISADLGLRFGSERTGTDNACSEIPNVLSISGMLSAGEAGCLVGMWASGAQRTGQRTTGHAIAVKPTEDVDGYAVFDPNFGEVKFSSLADTVDFLRSFLGQITMFRNGKWMVQQYLGCPAAVEELDTAFAAMGG